MDGGSDTILKITDYFNEKWLTHGTRTAALTDEQHTWKSHEILAYYDYDNTTKRTYLYFGRGILESSIYLYDDNNNEEQVLRYSIEITPTSEDAEMLFGGDYFEFKSLDTSKLPRVAISIWSRFQCLVKSSIANNDKNNILGHTLAHFVYTPIKYYRLNRDAKKFWIELYESRYHDCPVVFPSDKRDDVFIEAIVCFTGQAML